MKWYLKRSSIPDITTECAQPVIILR
jgi:hypothetical protein